MIDKLFGDFDPIKWIDDAFSGARHGATVKITWAADGPNGPTVEQYLRSLGVYVVKRQYSPEGSGQDFGVYVRAKQAKYADGLLRGKNWPVTSPELSRPISPRTTFGAPVNAVGMLGNVAENLFGGPSVNLPVKSNRRRRPHTADGRGDG